MRQHWTCRGETPRRRRVDLTVPPEIVIEDASGLRRRLASELQTRAHIAIAARGRVLVGLPGGSTAEVFFPDLAKVQVDWSRSDFFWIDERAVPPDNPESNYALAARLLLTPAAVPASRIHRMRGEDPDLERAARMAEDELISIAGNPPHLDVALAGVGEDGHIASIFPGHGGADRRSLGGGDQPCVVPVYNSPKPPLRRLTLTMAVLSRTDRLILIGLGALKSHAISDALNVKGAESPAGELLRRSRSPLVLLDHEAGRELSR